MRQKDLPLALVYFALSTLFTWWFVSLSPLYISSQQMLLSTSIAGGKWSIQILLGLVFLEGKSISFIKEIGLVCFIGSCLLMPYVVMAFLNISNSPNFFVGSLIIAVLAMIYFYYAAVRKMQLALRWWLVWLVCLTVAVLLQLTVVFHQISF